LQAWSICRYQRAIKDKQELLINLPEVILGRKSKHTMSGDFELKAAFSDDTIGSLLEGTSTSLSSSSGNSLPLNELLARIVAQEGPFGNLKESVLKQNIKNEEKKRGEALSGEDNQSTKNSNTNSSEEVAGSDDDASLSKMALNKDDLKRKLISAENFSERKEKAVKDVDTALNESSLSLDFVSLLISSLRPAAGSLSMSPKLKQSVKTGSLSSVGIKPHARDSAEIVAARDRKDKVVGRGWKLQSLSQAAQDLRLAAERLKSEVSKEEVYWSNMLKLVHSDEVIIPINPSDGRSAKQIGVKYGFGDAGSMYYDRGIGLLRKDNDTGKMYFERQRSSTQVRGIQSTTSSESEKLVVIRLYKHASTSQSSDDSSFNATLVGEASAIDSVPEQTGDNDGPGSSLAGKSKVLCDIERARFFLFEEELFYQLVKEAATLGALQVKVESESIVVELRHLTLKILFLPISDVRAMKISSSATTESYNRKAKEISIFFHLMLCSQHRHNLQRKRLPPVSLSKQQLYANKQIQQSVVILIRPLLAYQRHHRNILKVMTSIRLILMDLELKNSIKVDYIMKNSLKLRLYCNDPNRLSQNSNKLIKDNPFIRCLISPLSLMELRYKKVRILIELTSDLTASFSSINLKIDATRAEIPSETEDTTTSTATTAVVPVLNDVTYNVPIADLTFNGTTEFGDSLWWIMRNTPEIQ